MLKGKTIGFSLTASDCTYGDVFPVIEELVSAGANVRPVVSYNVKNTDTRFGRAEDHLKKLEQLTGNKPVTTIVEAETFGPNDPVDYMVVAPLTGNSLSKLTNAITDTPSLMATKATMRNQSPIVLAISTNDALGLNGVNLMKLIAAKGIYLVPFGQDNPNGKPNSLISKMDLIPETVEKALVGKQLQPMITIY